MERRLAAVLAADVAGYSRLMGEDEEGTLRRLNAHRRELIDPAIAAHGGRIVKATGDGLLAEFASPVEAVRCGVEIQRSMVDRNAETAAERRILFRIGINLGDIIAEDGDLYGDGVNVAARLEALAAPGGLCISGIVRDLVHNKLAYALQDLGPQAVKNIAQPVHAYAMSAEAISALPAAAARPQRHAPAAARKTGRWVAAAGAVAAVAVAVVLWLIVRSPEPVALAPAPTAVIAPTGATVAARLSIVVLPFANLSNDPEQDYLADGITDDLTTDLSQISGSFVIARNSAFTYKGKAADPRQVGKDLGVRYVLSGSVQRSEGEVRINAQLIDAESGKQLWADRFDYERGDLFKLQNEITGRIARALDLELVDAESRRSLQERPNNPDAVDLAMRGWSIFNKPRARENNVEARKLFEQAVGLDARDVQATVGLAVVDVNDVINEWCDKPEAQLQEADRLVAAALAVDPRHAYAYFVKSSILSEEERPVEAVAAAETAVSLNPSLAPAYAWIGVLQIRLGRAEDTVTYVQQALRLSPRDPSLANWLSFIGRAEFYLGRDDEAIDSMLKAEVVNPRLSGIYLHLAAAYALRNRETPARDALAQFEKLEPDTTIAKVKAETQKMSDNPTFLKQRERLYDGLRKAGMPEG
jgi:TolB-like protein/class 3 adenylate cyclase